MLLGMVKPFLVGFGVVLLALAVGYPITAIVSDVSNSGSFEVGSGLFVVYRFTREGATTATQLVPVGTLAWALLGGLVNLLLKLLIGNIISAPRNPKH